MKWKLVMSMCMLCVQFGWSCDMCNCYLGLNPGYNNNSAGLRWKFRHAEMKAGASALRTEHLEHDHGSSMAYDLDEYHNDLELFARYYPIPKLQVLLNMPYSMTQMTYGSESESMNAFGDLTVQAMYQLANTMPMDSNQARHRFFAGGGVKFPTGKSSGLPETDIPMSHHLLPGTGSTDFLAAMSYIGRKNNLGWNIDASYKMNGTGSEEYRYGNTINFTGNLFYDWQVSDFTLYPHTGLAFENGDMDTYQEEELSNTGGSMTWISGGVDIYFGKVAFANEVRLPVYENMAEGMSVDKLILVASVSYNF